MFPEQLDFVELEADEIRPLRTRVLRPETEPEDGAVFDGDDASSTRHYGICTPDGEPVAVVSYMRREPPNGLPTPSVRLRGMAVEEGRRRQGLGSRLLQSSLSHLAVEQPDLEVVWCNARVSAAAFYDREGFERRGDVFEVDGIGPHVLMWREMPRALAS